MKRGLKILLLADSWQILAVSMISPIYAIFVEKIGGDILDASWAYFTFMITVGIITFIISHWEDRVKHKEKMIVLGYAITALGCLFYFFVYNQTTLLMTQFILGIAEAIQIPAYDSVYSSFVDKDKTSSEWGDWEAMKYVTTGIAAIIGGLLANTYGFKVLFLVMTALALTSMFISLSLLRNKPSLSKT